MRKKSFLALFPVAVLILSLFLFNKLFIADAREQNSTKLHLIFFYSKNCLHCDTESLFLDTIAKKYPKLVIERYGVSEPGVMDKLMALAKRRNFTPGGTPVTFVDSTYFIGYISDGVTGKRIEAAIVKWINKCKRQ